MLAALLVSSVVVLVLVADSPTVGSSFPEGYLTVSTDLDHERAGMLLKDAGLGPVLAPSNTYVYLSRISRLEQVPLSELDALLDPLDPRRDPFMTELSSYFRIAQRNVMYVHAGDAPLARSRDIRRLLGPTTQIAELDIMARRLSFSLLVLGPLASLLISRRRFMVRLLAWVPLLVPVHLSGLGAALVSVVVGVAVDWVVTSTDTVGRLRDGDARASVRRYAQRYLWLIAVAALGGVSIAVIHGLASATAFAGALVAGLCLRAFPALVVGRSLDEGHQRFRPVQILSRPRFFADSPVERRVVPVVLLIVAVAVAGADLTLARLSSPRPARTRPVAADVTLDSLARLHDHNGLPDMSDYVAHRAYQESFLYGAPWRLPAEGEQIVIERYRLGDDGLLTPYEEPVLVFDQQWLDAALGGPPDGLVAMLVDRRAPSGVALAQRELLYSRYSRIVLHLLFLLLSGLPFLAGSADRARRIGTARSAGSPGRFRQVA